MVLAAASHGQLAELPRSRGPKQSKMKLKISMGFIASHRSSLATSTVVQHGDNMRVEKKRKDPSSGVSKNTSSNLTVQSPGISDLPKTI